MVLSLDGSLTSDLVKAQTTETKTELNKAEAPVALSASPLAFQASSTTSHKRPRPTDEEPVSAENGTNGTSQAKALKTEHDEKKEVSCKAPPFNNEAFLHSSLPRKDLYLDDGWRDRLCRCEKVSLLSPINLPR